ncbi:MAG: replication initiator protein A [Lachnospiraceae bacterium]|nr:replication initiator protein A [Lachnospiraceae bacterium]
MNFNYFYGRESDTFNFLPVPMILLTDPEFMDLSDEATLHYSRLLNRTSLSKKNGWFDEENRAYIIYTLEEMEQTTKYSASKCVKIMKELTSFGLIERVKRGQGKPDIIYVKDLMHPLENGSNPDKFTDFQKTEVKTSQNENSGILKSESLDFSNSEASNIDINNINNIKTDMSYTDPLPLLQPVESATNKIEEDDEENVKKQINYDRLIRMHQGNKSLISFILHQMVKMVGETNSMVEISSGHYEPKSRVLERIKAITYNDIENLLLMLPDKNDNNIKNPVGYMRKCLFNIVERIEAVCFTQQIKHPGNNCGFARQEYDFAELERLVNGG